MKQKTLNSLLSLKKSSMLQKSAAITVDGDSTLWDKTKVPAKRLRNELSAFFVPALWWGASERELFGAARFPWFPLSRNSSKTYPATLSFDSECGWFNQNQYQVTAMNKLSTVSFNNTELQIIDSDGQKWLSAADISCAMGYSNSNSITRLYDRNQAEFDDSMTCTVKLTVQGQTRKTRVFNKRGSHLIAMFAKTKKAAAFRAWVLDVLEQNSDTSQASANPMPRLNDNRYTYLLVKMRGAEVVSTDPMSIDRLHRYIADEHNDQLLIDRAIVARDIEQSLNSMQSAIASAGTSLLPFQLLLDNNDVSTAISNRMSKAMGVLQGASV